MKTEVFIHVGLHKTGTTFLQKEVFSKIPNINYQEEVGLETKVEEGKINLFSNENLDGGSYRLFNRIGQRYTIANNLHKLFQNARIIICIRDKKDWLKSAYKQYSIAYKSYSFNEYCQRIGPEIEDLFDYRYLIYLRKSFAGVYVCHFENLRKDPQKFVKELCDFIGVDIPNVNYAHHNIAITDNQIRLIRAFDFIFRSKLLHLGLSLCIKLVRKDVTIEKWGERNL